MLIQSTAKHGRRLSRASVLPDHVHLIVGCDVGDSPTEVALGYMNNVAYVLGMKAVFKYGFYVGTFGEYDHGAVSALRL
jgi:REP element-mobilizing transposase RayT